MTPKPLAVTQLAPARVRREQARVTATRGACYSVVGGVVEGVRARQAYRWARQTEEPQPPGARLTAEQHVVLEVRRAADGTQRSSDSDGIIDSRAGCRMIEILAAILPIVGWGEPGRRRRLMQCIEERTSQEFPDELLLLKIYDSQAEGPVRLSAHTAFEDPTARTDAPARRSIELRTLVFYPS
jgi:hypothetical protein